ncbi:hypothetical protein GOP47_0001460, partial [Adiantum capillus-veneris]
MLGSVATMELDDGVQSWAGETDLKSWYSGIIAMKGVLTFRVLEMEWFGYVHKTDGPAIIDRPSLLFVLVLYPEHIRIRELLVATTSVLDQFIPTVVFTVVIVETTTKSDGTSSCRLTIADGPAIIDRPSLLFVPSRANYQNIVNVINDLGYYSCVAHNINVFKQQTNILSIVDATILFPLPPSLESLFRQHLSQQVSNSGFGKM